jgi:hypothetical protein
LVGTPVVRAATNLDESEVIEPVSPYMPIAAFRRWRL